MCAHVSDCCHQSFSWQSSLHLLTRILTFPVLFQQWKHVTCRPYLMHTGEASHRPFCQHCISLLMLRRLLQSVMRSSTCWATSLENLRASRGHW